MIIGLIIGFVLFSTIAGWAAFKYLKKKRDITEPETGYYIGAPTLDKQFPQELQTLSTSREESSGGSDEESDGPVGVQFDAEDDQDCPTGQSFSFVQNQCVDFSTTGKTKAQEIESDNFVVIDGKNVAIVTEFEWVDKIARKNITINQSSGPICLRLGMMVPIWADPTNPESDIQRPATETGPVMLKKSGWDAAKENYAKLTITETTSEASFYWEIASQKAVFFVVTEWNSDCTLTLLDSENIGEDYFKYLANFQRMYTAHQPYNETKMWIPKTMKHPYARKNPYKISGTCPGGFTPREVNGPNMTIGTFYGCLDDYNDEQPIGTECSGYICVPALTKCENIPCTSNIHGMMCLSEHAKHFIQGFELMEDTLIRLPIVETGDDLKSALVDPNFNSWGEPLKRVDGVDAIKYAMPCWEDPKFIERTNDGKRVSQAYVNQVFLWTDQMCIDAKNANEKNLVYRTEYVNAQPYYGLFFRQSRQDASGKATAEEFEYTYPDTAKICHCPPHEDGRIRMCTDLNYNNLLLADDPKVTDIISDEPGGEHEGWWLHLCNSYNGVDGVCRNDRDLSADGEISSSSEWWCHAGGHYGERLHECNEWKSDVGNDLVNRWKDYSFTAWWNQTFDWDKIWNFDMHSI